MTPATPRRGGQARRYRVDCADARDRAAQAAEQRGAYVGRESAHRGATERVNLVRPAAPCSVQAPPSVGAELVAPGLTEGRDNRATKQLENSPRLV